MENEFGARDRKLLPALGLLVTVLVYLGYRLMFFVTDDAFIAFRYVNNLVLGRGLVWNPPPFLPVEGYTSWLWVAALGAVWKVAGIEPPQASNVLSLLFGYATLYLTRSKWQNATGEVGQVFLVILSRKNEDALVHSTPSCV